MKDGYDSSPPRDPRLHRRRHAHEIAYEDGERAKRACLQQRKLVLLVDLDQTVVHSTNRPPKFDPAKHPDITHFQLHGSNHWTKLRPHTRAFFENLAPMFEKHIISFGERQYAHKIAEIIDPTKKIFLDRILSREESKSQLHKTENLATLFPAGAEMVAIIDDRADVWKFCDRLVQLRPYKYFREVEDINAPPGAAERPSDAPSTEDEPAKADNLPEETDETLVHVERVLRKVHEQFYKHYDDTGNIRDLQVIISCLREQTLKGCVLVLSGLIPLGADPTGSDVYRIATKFGARVEDRVDEQTTHVVAARWGTTKVFEARRLGVPIVTPQWIYACMELWEKAPEQPFILTEKSVSPIGGAGNATVLDDLSAKGKELPSDLADNEPDNGEIPLSQRLVPPELKCALCLELLKEALPSPCCGESFCGECISYMLMDGTVCPQCKKNGVTIEQLVSKENARLAEESSHIEKVLLALNQMDADEGDDMVHHLKRTTSERQSPPPGVTADPQLGSIDAWSKKRWDDQSKASRQAEEMASSMAPVGTDLVSVTRVPGAPVVAVPVAAFQPNVPPPPVPPGSTVMLIDQVTQQPACNPISGPADQSIKPGGEVYEASRIRLKDAWEKYKSKDRGDIQEMDKSPKIQLKERWEEYKKNDSGDKKEKEKSSNIQPNMAWEEYKSRNRDRGENKVREKSTKIQLKETLEDHKNSDKEEKKEKEKSPKIQLKEAHSLIEGDYDRGGQTRKKKIKNGKKTLVLPDSSESGMQMQMDDAGHADEGNEGKAGMPIPVLSIVPVRIPPLTIPCQSMQKGAVPSGVYAAPIEVPPRSPLEEGEIVSPDDDDIIYLDAYGQVIPKTTVIPYSHSSNYGGSRYWESGSRENYERMEADRRYRANEERRRRQREDRRERGEREERDERRRRDDRCREMGDGTLGRRSGDEKKERRSSEEKREGRRKEEEDGMEENIQSEEDESYSEKKQKKQKKEKKKEKKEKKEKKKKKRERNDSVCDEGDNDKDQERKKAKKEDEPQFET